MSTQIERFLDHLSVERGLSGNTIAAYRRDLARYASFLSSRGVRDARAVDDAAVAGFIARLSSSTHHEGTPYRATSVVRALSSVRSFHRFLMREGRADRDPSAGVVRPKLPRSLPHPGAPRAGHGPFPVGPVPEPAGWTPHPPGLRQDPRGAGAEGRDRQAGDAAHPPPLLRHAPA